MKFKSIILFVACAMMASCSVPMATSYSYSEYSTAKSTHNFMTIPVVADLDVASKRISYGERIEKDITKMTDAEVQALAESEKETVIANAVKENNADVLVAPIVDIQTDEHHYLVIIVTGYPATYKNFRNVTSADVDILGIQQPVNATTQEKKQSKLAGLFKK